MHHGLPLIDNVFVLRVIQRRLPLAATVQRPSVDVVVHRLVPAITPSTSWTCSSGRSLSPSIYLHGVLPRLVYTASSHGPAHVSTLFVGRLARSISPADWNSMQHAWCAVTGLVTGVQTGPNRTELYRSNVNSRLQYGTTQLFYGNRHRLKIAVDTWLTRGMSFCTYSVQIMSAYALLAAGVTVGVGAEV